MVGWNLHHAGPHRERFAFFPTATHSSVFGCGLGRAVLSVLSVAWISVLSVARVIRGLVHFEHDERQVVVLVGVLDPGAEPLDWL
jgi:hypothetical protein